MQVPLESGESGVVNLKFAARNTC